MEASRRIDRMEEAGLLTPQQADALRASLEGRGPGPSRPRRGAAAGLLLAVAGCVVTAAVIVVLFLGAGGGTEVVEDVSQAMNQPGATGMYKGVSMVLAAVLMLLLPLLTWAWLHNALVAKEEAAYAAWAQVESNYQRRSDLIPALVETVGRFLRHESETLEAVTRERAAPATLDEAIEALVEAQRSSTRKLADLGGEPPSDRAGLDALSQAQAQVGLGMRRLMAIAESYPDLRSADQFLELQAQLEGTENRINVSRMRFNDAVRAYNAATRKLPGSLVANAGGFKRKAYFESDEGARHAEPLGLD